MDYFDQNPKLPLEFLTCKALIYIQYSKELIKDIWQTTMIPFIYL